MIYYGAGIDHVSGGSELTWTEASRVGSRTCVEPIPAPRPANGPDSDRWWDHAGCEGRDDLPWFPERKTFAVSPEIRSEMQGLCGSCPVRMACLRETLAAETADWTRGSGGRPQGFRAGFSAIEREVLLGRRAPRSPKQRVLKDVWDLVQEIAA